jgi:dTDP-4-amino-4,6-dideoxygalactose transaminase
MTIPLTNLKRAIEETEPVWRAHLAAMHRRGQFILGQQVEAFEREFASAMGAKFAVGVGSGTGAIELCLRAADITTRRQEVLTSPLTSPFTGLAILSAGASPSFADIDADSLLLDPTDAGNRLRKRTAALLPVHLYGQPCDPRRFRRLECVLIHDACQAHGARFRGRPLTDFSPYVAYSFYPTKNLGCLGDGGAVVTDSRRVAERIRLLRDGGRAAGHVSVAAGINSRLDEMQACYLRAFLPRLEAWNAARRRIAALYDEAFRGCDAVRPVKRWPCSVNHLYVVRVARRDRLREHLSRQGIGTGVHYPAPLHLHPTFSDCGLKRGDLPRAEKAAKEIVSLPMGPYLTEGAVARVASAILHFY